VRPACLRIARVLILGWFAGIACLAWARQPSLSPEDLARKKEGWYPLGLPFANGNTDFGFGAGGGLYLFYTGHRTNADGSPNTEFARWPHEVRLGFQLYFTTLGQQKHFLNLDIPRLGNDRFSLSAEAAWWTTLAENYFGIGGNTPGLAAAPGYQQVTSETPYLTARLTSGLFGDLALLTAVKIRYARLVSRSNARRDDGVVIGTTLFDEEHPVGWEGGWANSATLGLVFDRRDFTPWPRKGVFAQLSYDGYPGGFSERVFGRWNGEFSGFVPLAKTLVACARVSASEILGEAPFWEYARLGGNDRLRGLADRRFLDRSMVLANLEARWRALDWRIRKEQFHLALVPFLDLGQVAPSILSPLMWRGWHLSTGFEAILTWNLSTHLNVTAGFSVEGFAFAVDTRVMF